ncbi:MAG: MBL fold metallo-hydrolase, partial [Erysipelotrichaceae bacterium]|nr:MBL fold metallo-hydrolase [Erysipelotrichaceae bacterium]
NRILKAIRNHPDSELYEFLFYGWTAKDSAEWIASLGLPVMGFLSLAGSFLRRNGLKVHEWCILCGFIVLYGSLFGWTVSLARAALFRLISSLVQKDALKLPLSIFAFCFLMPHQASSFAFVLPSAAGLMSRFALKPKDAKWASVALCAGLQAVYFSSINPAGLFLFPFLRKLAGWIFLLFSLLFFFPDIWLFEQASRWLNEILTSEVIIWHGMARPVFKLCLLTALILWLLYPVQKKWILAAALLVHPASYALDPFFHVYVLDVGQGDCTLIVEPFQKSAVMIDAAGNLSGTLYKSSIAPFLKSHGIRKLDALIITHDDLDHSGSKDAVLKDYPDCQLIEDLKTPVPVSYPFYSLFQERPESFSEENDQSIVNWFSYDGISYLWMGDATIKVEEQLLEDYDLKADILKAGHHGSATSSSYDFLYETAPSAAVITAGFENRYNHPSASVMDSLEELKIESLQTSGLGSIHLFSWKGFLFMTTQQKHAGILQTPGKQLG